MVTLRAWRVPKIYFCPIFKIKSFICYGGMHPNSEIACRVGGWPLSIRNASPDLVPRWSKNMHSVECEGSCLIDIPSRHLRWPQFLQTGVPFKKISIMTIFCVYGTPQDQKSQKFVFQKSSKW